MTLQDESFDYSAIQVLCGHCARPMVLRRDVEAREAWRIHRFECENDTCRAARDSASVISTLLEVPADGAAVGADGSVHIRNISLRCGRCDAYPALAHFRRETTWNVYTFECEPADCGAEPAARDLYVAIDRDAFARRDPNWRGGARHAGADPS